MVIEPFTVGNFKITHIELLKIRYDVLNILYNTEDGYVFTRTYSISYDGKYMKSNDIIMTEERFLKDFKIYVCGKYFMYLTECERMIYDIFD